MELHKKALKELIKQLCDNCKNGVDEGCECNEGESCAKVWAAKEVLESSSVILSSQHAHSLAEMVKYFKGMIETGKISDDSIQWYLYCDELLEDLEL